MSSCKERTNRAQVRRRRVIFIPGYDPFHPRRYRELYRKEAAAQAAISSYQITLEPKASNGAYGWHVTGAFGGQSVEADVDVLVWSDIVQASMGPAIAATYGAMLRTAWVYIRSGALFRLMRLRKGPVIAALYPVVMLMLQATAALAAGYIAGSATYFFIDWLAGQLNPAHGATGGATLIGIGAGLVVVWIVLSWFRRRDAKLLVYYLMHDYSYSALHRGAYPPELEERLAHFADAISDALESAVDEVLVVGHSSGAHLAASVLADLIREGRVPPGGPALGFLSLGQVIPMVSFLPDATRLRRDLHDLSQTDRLTWIDVTAPGDGCAFALCDPVAVSGVAPEKGKRWPIVFSAAFTQSLSAERWKDLRWRFFRLHFQYLCAFDAPRDYDYFQITAGPLTLADRYGDRLPSRSRKETPVNRFTSIA